MFSFACNTLFHTFPHSKSTKSNDFTSIQLRIYTHTLRSRRELRIRRRIRWQLEVSRKCLSLLIDYESSRVEFRLPSLVYLLQMLLPGQPSCTHKSLMASTSILISCLLYRAHFSFPSSIPTPSSPHVARRYHHHSIIRTIRLASYFPDTYVRPMSLFPTSRKSEHARYAEFFPFWRSRFLYD